MKFIKKISLAYLVLMLLSIHHINAQGDPIVVDKIIGRVDNYAIFLSDLERAYESVIADGQTPGEATKCEILQGLVINKLLVAKAEIDSVIIDPGRIELELDRRMRYFEIQAGGKDKLETAFGKSIYQLKNELREQVQEQLTVQQMQQEITADVKVTPGEVKKYFNSIPQDSLPFLASEVQVGQIVRYPEISSSEKAKAKNKIIEIKTRIENGEDFADLAKKHSQDPGSKKQGGELGWVERGQFAPEFEAAALTMDIDEIVGPIETEFGFHLIHLLDRKGSRFRSRHILIRSESNDLDIDQAEAFLDSLRDLIVIDSLKFTDAAKEFTDDKETKGTSGMFTDGSTGATWVSTDILDPVIFFTIDSMKLGNITKPIRFRNADGEPAVRIIYYKDYRKPHFANLREDYQKLYLAALNKKKSEVLREWLSRAKKEVYIDVDARYNSCRIVEDL